MNTEPALLDVNDKRTEDRIEQSPLGQHVDSPAFDMVEEASQASFPASDPPAWTLGR